MAIWLTYQWQRDTTERLTKQQLHRDLASHMRDDNPLMIGTDYNPKALKSIFHTLMLIGPDFEIYFLDSQGRITTHAAPEGASLTKQIDVEPLKRFLDQQPLPILGDDPRNPQQKKVFSVAAIEELGSTVGYLYVVIGSTQHGALAARHITTPYMALALLLLVSITGFAVGAYVIVKRSVLKPVEKVTEQLIQQAEDDYRLSPTFDAQVPELTPIAHSYQLMAKQIQRQFLQLESQSATQQQTLLQLSHDLKTPLSSIIGYLETWRLQHQEQAPLIDIAYRNSQKMSKQLQRMLDMARVNSRLDEIEFSELSATELLSDCISMLEQQVQFCVQNRVDANASSGSLGIGTRIVTSILMLHHSSLQTTATETCYRQSFRLNAPS